MPAAFFEEAWRICCLGGFIAGQAAANRRPPAAAPSCSPAPPPRPRRRPPFLAFAAKVALRCAAGSAREQVQRMRSAMVIDGRSRGDPPQTPAEAMALAGENELPSPAAIAEARWQLHLQHPRRGVLHLTRGRLTILTHAAATPGGAHIRRFDTGHRGAAIAAKFAMFPNNWRRANCNAIAEMPVHHRR